MCCCLVCALFRGGAARYYFVPCRLICRESEGVLEDAKLGGAAGELRGYNGTR